MYPFTEEQFKIEGVKLNLGCGDVYLDGFVNVDLYAEKADEKLDIRKLDVYQDNSIALILASHVIEHFHWDETLNIIKEWYRVLLPGGWLVMEFPDATKCFKSFLEIAPTNLYLKGQLFPQIIGNSSKPGHEHKTLLWMEHAGMLLKAAGFNDIWINENTPISNIKQWVTRLDCRK